LRLKKKSREVSEKLKQPTKNEPIIGERKNQETQKKESNEERANDLTNRIYEFKKEGRNKLVKAVKKQVLKALNESSPYYIPIVGAMSSFLLYVGLALGDDPVAKDVLTYHDKNFNKNDHDHDTKYFNFLSQIGYSLSPTVNIYADYVESIIDGIKVAPMYKKEIGGFTPMVVGVWFNGGSSDEIENRYGKAVESGFDEIIKWAPKANCLDVMKIQDVFYCAYNVAQWKLWNPKGGSEGYSVDGLEKRLAEAKGEKYVPTKKGLFGLF